MRATITNLAGDLPAVERRVLGDIDRHPGRRVDVDGEAVLVAAAEEALPERRQRQDAVAGEEHEGHLGHALERVPGGGRHQRGAPEQLLVRHVVHEPRRGHEFFELGVQVGPAADAAAATATATTTAALKPDAPRDDAFLGQADPGTGRHPEAGDDAEREDHKERDHLGEAGDGLVPREHHFEIVKPALHALVVDEHNKRIRPSVRSCTTTSCCYSC